MPYFSQASGFYGVYLGGRAGRWGGGRRALPPFAVARQALDVLERQLALLRRGLAELAADLARRRVSNCMLGGVRVGADGAEVGGDVVGVRRAGLVDDRGAQGALFLHQIRDGGNGNTGKREDDRDEAAGHDQFRTSVVVVVVVVVVVAVPRIYDFAVSGFVPLSDAAGH